METDLNIKIQTQEKVSVLELSGDLDAFTCVKLHDTIIDITNDGVLSLIISMAKIKYIDSSGLGTLVGGLRRISELEGTLALCGASPQVRKVFDITGLSRVFQLYESREEALSNMDKD